MKKQKLPKTQNSLDSFLIVNKDNLCMETKTNSPQSLSIANKKFKIEKIHNKITENKPKRTGKTILFTTMYGVPYHKKIPNTSITVDYFTHIVTDSSYNYLSHFHTDHYNGLSSKYKGRIVCSVTTSNLIRSKFRVNTIPLEQNKWYKMIDHYVYLIDAKHCPGAVCFIFYANDLLYLHCGDFRCTTDWYCDINFSYNEFMHTIINDLIIKKDNLLKNKILSDNYIINNKIINNNVTNVLNEININKINEPIELNISKPNTNICIPITKLKFNKIFLDNTFEGVKDFDSQHNIINKIIKDINKRNNVLFPIEYKYMFVSYSVGKEKVFFSIAEKYDWSICIRNYKKIFLNNLCDYSLKLLENEIKSILSKESVRLKERLTDKDAEIYVISLSDVNLERISKICNSKRVVVIFPTGWSRKNYVMKNDNITVEVMFYRYSEHSSDNELNKFKETMHGEIINTVKHKQNY